MIENSLLPLHSHHRNPPTWHPQPESVLWCPWEPKMWTYTPLNWHSAWKYAIPKGNYRSNHLFSGDEVVFREGVQNFEFDLGGLVQRKSDPDPKTSAHHVCVCVSKSLLFKRNVSFRMVKMAKKQKQKNGENGGGGLCGWIYHKVRERVREKTSKGVRECWKYPIDIQ